MKRLMLMLGMGLTCFAQEDPLRLDTTGAEWAADGATMRVPEIAQSRISTGELDGHWYTSVRFSSPDAAGLQFLIDDLALPEGAALYLLEMSREGEVVRGVYEGSGPLDGTAFWSDAVHGTEAVLRVVYNGQAAAGLPFRVIEARHLNSAGLMALAGVSPAERTAPQGSAIFRGRAVAFREYEGLAITEGDIILGPVDEMQPASAKDSTRQSMGLTSTSYRWTGGLIPYAIDPALPNPARVTNAIAHWNVQLAGAIQLLPRTTETAYVRFTYSATAGLCSSYLGRTGMSPQPVNLGDYCSTGNVIHEIGHALGLFHEHTREDRDSKVQVNFANINPSAAGNFNQAISSSDDLGAYDYNSIMHYPATAFSINGQPTIVTIPAGIPIGQRSALSTGDIAGVRRMYPTVSTPSTVQVTINSNPAGRSLVVDGATVTAPAIFNWTPGGAHSVSAPSSATTTSRFTFSSWSDGGAQTHNYTAPSAGSTLTANFAASYRITAISGNSALGSVTVSPVSADSFYARNTAVTVTAATTGGGCLGSWSGIAAPPSSPLQISATQSYSIVGNFQTGAVTLSVSSVSGTWRGGRATIPVTSTTGCAWTAVSNANWIQVIGGAGNGSGWFQISVARNQGAARTGSVSVGTATLQVAQSAR